MKRAILHGGPSDIPSDARHCPLQGDEEKIKLPWCGGYEHFERDLSAAAEGNSDMIVFRWTMRTKIAE